MAYVVGIARMDSPKFKTLKEARSYAYYQCSIDMPCHIRGVDGTNFKARVEEKWGGVQYTTDDVVGQLFSDGSVKVIRRKTKKKSDDLNGLGLERGLKW